MLEEFDFQLFPSETTASLILIINAIVSKARREVKRKFFQ